MIVMKFGGASLESVKAIERVISIVESHIEQQPFLVVSALGTTTDCLLKMAADAADGRERLALEILSELREYHLNAAERLARGRDLVAFRRIFLAECQELECTLKTLAQGHFHLTLARTDEIVSCGERWSSRIVSLALDAAGVSSKHFDARRLIVTDDRHTQAVPLYPECYARIRRAIRQTESTGVMGGFIGATESGVTTTLGRGGSDLTATIAGAAVQAEEVQFWKDVDGILTCDPEVLPEVYTLTSISYTEAIEMARCGANVLHSATVTPAIEQGIPLVVRSFVRPRAKGTRIVPRSECSADTVKSIVCTRGIALLQVSVADPAARAELIVALSAVCGRHNIREELTALEGETLFWGIKSAGVHPDLLREIESVSESALLEGLAVISLIGDKLTLTPAISRRIAGTLQGIAVFATLNNETRTAIRIIVAQNSLVASAKLLHREFFGNSDLQTFVSAVPAADAAETIVAS
jgi:aspartate kinase